MGLYKNISGNAIDNRVVCTACFSSDTKGWQIFFPFHCHIVYFVGILLRTTKHSRGIGLACCHSNVYLEPCLYAIN